MANSSIPTSTRDRLDYLLDHQPHCDLYLSEIADPRGKTVLVAGSGAGTEMLWCLRHGAREVVGIDLLPQEPEALRLAVEQLELPATSKWEIRQLGVEDAPTLGRSFDLVLSNNVVEHVGDIGATLKACAAMIAPGTGRIAIFTDPLYYSSTGSHRSHPPWQHLIDPDLLAPQEEIPLNRMRLADLLGAARAADLAILHVELIPDRALAELPTRLEALRAAPGSEGIDAADLALEGIAIELMRLAPAPSGAVESPAPVASVHATREYLAQLHAGRISLVTVLGENDAPLAAAPPLRVDPDGEPLALRFELPPSSAARSLRWAPLHNRFVRIWLTEVEWEDAEGKLHPIEPAALRTNGSIGPDGSIRFATFSPWIAFDLAPGARPVRLRLAGAWKVAAQEAALAELENRLDARLGRISRLYLDTGRGFSEQEALAERTDPTTARLALRFRLPEPLTTKRLRWDPTEGQLAIVRIETVFAERASGARVPLNAASAETNGTRLPDGAIAFDTLDPWIIFPISGEVAAFEVRGSWQVLDTGQRLDEISNELASLRQSRSYRLGRALTAPLRWFKRG
ncbi:MAG TPA: methyltransferase domain-containing protein [Thermoanaerobaculia bacterium]|jgi:SAM-dependent methyltransferase|nr:methyltransferase domain-containing protein [Thermoanaerobaculia bacterium]